MYFVLEKRRKMHLVDCDGHEAYHQGRVYSNVLVAFRVDQSRIFELPFSRIRARDLCQLEFCSLPLGPFSSSQSFFEESVSGMDR